MFMLLHISTDATVCLESMWYIATEGEAVEICATVKNPANVECLINFEFTLMLSTVNDSAGFY